jgi:hypothetical protein
MADRSLKLLSKNRLDDWSIVGCIRLSCLNFWTKVCLPEFFEITRRADSRNQKNPGNRGKGNGVKVSNGSSKSARNNTASVSAEPTTNSTIASLSCARLMTCNTKRNGEKFHGGASHTAPNPTPQKGVTSIMLRIRLRRYRDALGKNIQAGAIGAANRGLR